MQPFACLAHLICMIKSRRIGASQGRTIMEISAVLMCAAVVLWIFLQFEHQAE